MKHEELERILAIAQVPVHEWGKGRARSLNNLVEEEQAGLCDLRMKEGGKLVRLVHVSAGVVLYRKESRVLRLMEGKAANGQEVAAARRDDRFSFRENRKMGEPDLVALERGLLKIMGPQATKARIAVTRILTDSGPTGAYPGLESEYKTTVFYVWVHDGGFNPEGYTREYQDRKVRFTWDVCPRYELIGS
jgi:hypothetical protein